MNIQFSSLDKPLKSLMIASPQPNDGKSIILANLGVVMAQAGLRVILIDTDLRRPSIHKIFGLQNSSGLSNAVLLPFPGYRQYLQETSIKNLRILTSGPLPPSPGELIGSARFGEMIDCMKQESDVLLFDSPPCLLVADSAILGTRVDGVILVNSSGKTKKKEAQKAVEELGRVRANMLGVVLNHQFGSSKDYYKSQYYYYHADEKPDKRNGWMTLPVRRLTPSGHPGDESKSEKPQSESR
jgi:capsular exopolysaccharide synthesis family protein